MGNESNGAAIKGSAYAGEAFNEKEKSTKSGNGMLSKEHSKREQSRREPKEPPAPEAPPPVPYFTLYKYADTADWFFLSLGIGGALFMGASLPLFTILFGNIINKLGDKNGNNHLEHDVRYICLWFTGLACCTFAAGWLQISGFTSAGLRITNRIRLLYLQAALRQDIAFFDVDTQGGGILAAINEDTVHIQGAISDKAAVFLQGICCFIVGFIVAFWRAWEITLIGSAAFPLMAISAMLFGLATTKVAQKAQSAYNKAQSASQEAIMNARTVYSFNMQRSVTERYAAKLVEPLKAGIFHAWALGVSVGVLFASIFATYAVVMRWGSYRVAYAGRSGGDVINVILCLIIAGFSLGQALPSLNFFRNGTLAAARVYRILDRRPVIDPDAKEGIQDERQIQGAVELRDVTFRYPARPDTIVFDKFNLTVEPGKSLALVGESGSGKSTVIGLVQRFYDPMEGAVLIDGIDLRQYNIKWLRARIGLVSQEPTLFSASILDNVKYGRDGATEVEVKAALEAANCTGFISRLPDGIHTVLGERGLSLSGGQKQRICIARALIRNPRILLLDEATSALDAESEKVVQGALDKVMVGRTSIVVAHRLSTVRDCSNIAVVQRGKIVELGPHDELVAKQGAYYQLVRLQNTAEKSEAEESEESSSDDPSVTTSPDTKPEPEPEERKAKRRSFVLSLPLGAARKSDVTSPAGLRKSTADEVPHAHAHHGHHHADSIELEDYKEEEKEKEYKVKNPTARLLKLVPDQIPVLLLGLAASAGNGAIMPIYAYLLSEVIGVFYKTKKKDIIDGGIFWAWMFCVISFGCLILNILQQRCVYGVGQHLAKRIREVMLGAILSQEIGWFDMPDNSTGALATRLSQDALYVRGAMGDQIGALVMNIGTLATGLTIAFTASWKVTLVVLATLPALAVGGYYQAKVMTGFETEGAKMFQKANSVATDAFASIRVCTAFGLQPKVLELYSGLLRGPSGEAVKKANVNGLGWGWSNFAQFGMIALAFWWGGQLILRDEITLVQLLKAFFAILFAGIGASQAQIAFPDLGKAKVATQNVFRLLDRVPKILSGSKKVEDFKGEIELRDVTFRYPSRPQVTVFHKFSLKAPIGKTLALVGESGSGKSTVIQLVERFYDPIHGSVLLDGVDMRDLDLAWIRSQIGLVSQEPSLFEGTIRENILYGRPGASDEEVEAAARTANAYDFIGRQSDGFDTYIGERGLQLSGGQKQRIAIARAVLKNPKVLLLDEATSALDAESEKLVQGALDKLMEGRTTLVVAHRLSTIRNAHTIAVVQRGKIVETGSHDELVKRPDGAYYKLIKIQLAGGH